MKLKHLVEARYGKDVSLQDTGLTRLPTDLPEKITGNFLCSENGLTSLEHCPSEVGGDFSCSHNKLTSLKFCPSQIGGDFLCSENGLTSLEHCPSEVGGDFYCSYNKLTSLKDVHTHIRKIDGGFRCFRNHIESHILGLMLIEIGGEIITRLGDGKDVDMILNKWKNQGRKGALGAQRELLDLGYDQLAQL
jgi:hypothetical protein